MSLTRIRLETEAKLVIQQKIRDGECELLWSSTLDFKNSRNPFEEHMQAIREWRKLTVSCVMADAEVVKLARETMALGIREYDALHVASAIAGNADVLVTTDDRLIKRMRQFGRLKVLFPVEAVAYLENWYED
jgi:predicted nucleic acid-binding protein